MPLRYAAEHAQSCAYRFDGAVLRPAGNRADGRGFGMAIADAIGIGPIRDIRVRGAQTNIAEILPVHLVAIRCC
jgi:hypothetical protein